MEQGSKSIHDAALLHLRDILFAVEEDRTKGHTGCTIDELDRYLDDILLQNQYE